MAGKKLGFLSEEDTATDWLLGKRLGSLKAAADYEESTNSILPV